MATPLLLVLAILTLIVGPGQGEGLPSCRFPFIFKNVTYTSCTTEADPDGQLWCSTKTDNQNNHIIRNWMHCTGEDKGCLFAGTVYPDGNLLLKPCMEMKCNAGSWEFTKTFNKDCGLCGVGRDVHIWTYEKVTGHAPHHDRYESLAKAVPNELYQFGGGSEYVLSQPNFTKPAIFGVHGYFLNVSCNSTGKTPDGQQPSCLNWVSYHQDKLTVKLIYCAEYTADPNCAIKVEVNGKDQTITEKVKTYGTDGEILVFRAKHHGANLPSNAHPVLQSTNYYDCVNVVGSKIFTLIACDLNGRDPSVTNFDYPFAFILANPFTSPIYGLCNTLTGQPAAGGQSLAKTPAAAGWTLQNGTQVQICPPFIESWKIGSQVSQ